MEIIQEAERLVEEVNKAPPPIDLTQPLWVQQERRIMFDIMSILTAAQSHRWSY